MCKRLDGLHTNRGSGVAPPTHPSQERTNTFGVGGNVHFMKGPGQLTSDDVLAHTEWVTRLSRALAGADGEDLSQDVWEATLDAERPRGDVRGWLTGVVRNLSAMRTRATQRRLQRELGADQPDATPSADELLERIELQREVARMVTELEEPVRLVLFLRFYEGLSSADIARQLDLPAGTVRWRLKTGIDALRAQLDRRFEGERAKWVGMLLPISGALMKAQKTWVGGVVAAAVAVVVLLGAGAWWWWPASSASQSELSANTNANVLGLAVIANSPSATTFAAARVNGDPLDPLAAPGAPPRRVAGVVLFEGKPVSGAIVRLAARPAVNLDALEVRTAADGRFDFGERTPRKHSVSAAASGKSGVVLELDLDDPSAHPAPESLELILGACESRVSGHVFDSGGGPIVNASVRPAWGIGVHTDQSGAYELCLRAGTNDLHVSAAGYASALLAVMANGPTKRDIVLTPGTTLRGRVVDEKGTAVPNAVVRASSPEVDLRDTALIEPVLTDAAGRFRVSVAPGDYTLDAAFGGARASSQRRITAVVGEEGDEILLTLRAGSTVRGVVRDGGKPVAGARVTVFSERGQYAHHAFSQKDGSYVVQGITRGEIQFAAPPWKVTAPTRFELRSADETVDLEVTRLGRLHGRVTFQGKPVAWAEVRVMIPDWPLITNTASDGTWSIDGLETRRYRVLANSTAVGAFVEVTNVEVVEGEDKKLDLELRNAGRILGSVITADGKPVPGVSVWFRDPKTRDECRVSTDAEGRFVCAQLVGGDYVAQVAPDERSPRPFRFVKDPGVVKVDGETGRVDDVSLIIEWEQLTISGRVLDASGGPMADVRVRACEAEVGEMPHFSVWELMPSTVTDAQGRFQFSKLVGGTWALQARANDGAETVKTSVTAGTEGVVITLGKPSGVEGTLVGFESAPSIFAQDRGRVIPGEVNGSKFTVVLPAGRWIITAFNQAEADSKIIDVKEGVVSKLTLTSHGKGVVRGHVLEHGTNAPLPAFSCRVAPVADEQVGFGLPVRETQPKSDATGAFAVDPSPAGNIIVACELDSGEFSDALRAATLPAGGSVDLELFVVRRKNAGGSIGLDMPWRASTSIRGVAAGSAAAQAGVLAGDVVLAVDGVPVTMLGGSGIDALISNHTPGSALALTVQRGSARREFTMVVGSE
ncbi:MAG: sigma-70 family RNA polymerase sigma factor [Archangium sp.]